MFEQKLGEIEELLTVEKKDLATKLKQCDYWYVQMDQLLSILPHESSCIDIVEVAMNLSQALIDCIDPLSKKYSQKMDYLVLKQFMAEKEPNEDFMYTTLTNNFYVKIFDKFKTEWPKSLPQNYETFTKPAQLYRQKVFLEGIIQEFINNI